MGLKVKKGIKHYLPKIIIGVLAVAVAGFLIKVAVWEYNYYSGMEGSERAIAEVVGDVTVSEEEEIDQTEVTEADKDAYEVPADSPRYLSIDKLGIVNARVVTVGTLPSGQMATPNNIYDVGWWSGSNRPGTGGTAILDGHNGANLIGVFKHLPELTSGDLIKIELGDGTLLTYRVYDNITVALSEANSKMHLLANSPVVGEESISIITCTGEWSYNQNTYLSRQFLRATLTSRSAPTRESTSTVQTSTAGSR